MAAAYPNGLDPAALMGFCSTSFTPKVTFVLQSGPEDKGNCVAVPRAGILAGIKPVCTDVFIAMQIQSSIQFKSNRIRTSDKQKSSDLHLKVVRKNKLD